MIDVQRELRVLLRARAKSTNPVPSLSDPLIGRIRHRRRRNAFAVLGLIGALALGASWVVTLPRWDMVPSPAATPTPPQPTESGIPDAVVYVFWTVDPQVVPPVVRELERHGYRVREANEPYETSETALYYRPDYEAQARQIAARSFPDAAVRPVDPHLNPDYKVVVVLGPDYQESYADPTTDISSFLSAFVGARADGEGEHFLSGDAINDYASGKHGIWLNRPEDRQLRSTIIKIDRASEDLARVTLQLTYGTPEDCAKTITEHLRVGMTGQGLKIIGARWEAGRAFACA